MAQPASDPAETAALIRKKARNLGFDDCRICAAEAAGPEHESAYSDWLAQGMHGAMRWFEHRKGTRIDLRSRYPWARSLVVLRCDYPNAKPGAAAPAGSVASRIARYAAGLDYHERLKPELERMENYLLRFSDGVDGEKRNAGDGCRALWYQDTGPILEHVYAQRAGIGWTGKHTLTLNEQDGSYFFLAEVITSLELPVDAAATDHCGNCTACIDACPTDAIFEPYKLDARKCISYLTIEHQGPVAEELRGQFAGYLYGCDICQEVCPYNVKAVKRDGARAAADTERSAALEALRLEDVLLFRDAKLDAAVAGTPLARTGASRLKQTAALLAGEEAAADVTGEMLKGVVHCITHPESDVREACAWALGCYATTPLAAKARQALATHQKRETEEPIRDAVIAALQRFAAPVPSAVLVTETISQLRAPNAHSAQEH